MCVQMHISLYTTYYILYDKCEIDVNKCKINKNATSYFRHKVVFFFHVPLTIKGEVAVRGLKLLRGGSLPPGGSQT